MKPELKNNLIASLTKCLLYPETTNSEEWHQAEIINQKILNLIKEVIKL